MRGIAHAFVAMLLVCACSGSTGASPPLSESLTFEASPTPPAAPSNTPTTSAPSSFAGDAATALDLASRYENARAAGRWSEAWVLLSVSSQQVIGTLADFEANEAVYNQSGGTVFEVQEPTNDAELVSMFVTADQANQADMTRGLLVFIQHPNVKGASAGSEGLLVAPDLSGEWRIWIVH